MPGVAQAQIGGDRRPSIRIQVDPARLAALGLTLEEIRPAIVNATTAAPKGMLNTAEVGFTIAAYDQILEAEPFNDVILAYRNGGPIRVRDVGQAVAEASMMRLQRALGEMILSDPDVQGFASQTGNNDNPTTANTGRFSIVLKPFGQRKASASQVVERLRSRVAGITGVNLFMQVAQDINVGVRFSRGGFEYTLQGVDIAELIEWSQKLVERMRTLPELTNVSSDLLAKFPATQGHDQSRPSFAVRNFSPTDRRHALRRLRPAAGDAILYTTQYEPGHS
jgi:multidrug efflux pump subunit AcrB